MSWHPSFASILGQPLRESSRCVFAVVLNRRRGRNSGQTCVLRSGNSPIRITLVGVKRDWASPRGIHHVMWKNLNKLIITPSVSLL